MKRWTRLINLWPGSPRRKERTQINKKWERRHKNWYHNNNKDHRECYKPLYANKYDNLEEIDKFLETYPPDLNHSPPKLNQEIDNYKRPITRGKMEYVILKLPIKKSPGPDGFTGEFYQTYKEEITLILLKSFQKTKEEFQRHSLKLP